MIAPKLRSSLAYGGDYNPEQWPEPVWREDVRLMREAGVNLVTVGVFAWSRLQPREGRYDFGWLDRVMDLLAANGIFACLGTATASPPAWLSHGHPDVLAVDADGLPFHHGSRQHYSPCSPSYRRFAAALVRRLAARYARHPALALWHVNNEYGNHVRECHSPAAARAFRAWLRRKYATLDRLNDAWGTSFWSQTYDRWEEVSTPRRTPFSPNPTQQLDFRRFMSDALLGLFTMERDIVRAANPAIPVTTNLMGFHPPIDGFAWSRRLDVVSWNSYPDPNPGARGECAAAAGHDLARSLKKDRPFLLMEQAPSWVNWPPSTGTKPPGLLRLWTLQAIARGADAAMFFQWRASRYGAEKFMSGMVPHVPPELSRVFAEVTATGADLAALAPVAGSRCRSRAAIVLDWNAWWAVELGAKPARFDYSGAVRAIHRHFYERNIAVDFVHPSEPLESYRLVVAPLLYLLRRGDAGRLSDFVRRGGTLVVTSFSGIVDENDHVVLGGYPAALREALGMWVEEWAPYVEGRENRVRFLGPRTALARCRRWCEVIRLEGARSLAVYERDFFAGRPAACVHRFGLGSATYVGTELDDPGLALLLDGAAARAGLRPLIETPPRLEAAWREAGAGGFLFLLNHGDRPARVPLWERLGADLLGDAARRGGGLRLPALGAAVLRFEKAQLRPDGSLVFRGDRPSGGGGRRR